MAGSTLPRRAMGRVLRAMRMKAGKSQLAAALAIDLSPQTIGRMEDGQPVKMSSPQMNALLEFYGADKAHRTTVMGLLLEAKKAKGNVSGGWWKAYADVVAGHFNHYMSLEDACSRMTMFELTLIPGLFQTAAYRRAMILISDPQMAPVDIDRRIELAERRQTKLSDSTFTMNVLLSEAALRHRVGSRLVMKEQLLHLVEIGQLPNVSLRVIPLDVESHIGLVVQSFTMLEFPPLRATRLIDPPVVYIEEHLGALFLEDDAALDRYRTAAEDIRGVSLSEEDTMTLIKRIAEEYGE
ncbi:helix-turn-helix domain-containing protein [Nocardia terpenica]|nr:helix-turn-helix transcriptional regulator [Nocardia terpenica]